MADISDYTSLLAGESIGKPKFSLTVQETSKPFVEIINTINTIPTLFDVDFAVGDQLDAIGLWVGVGRTVKIPIGGVYFSWQSDGVGWGQGVWKGQYDPGSGISTLDDGTYRILIKAKIAANHWDGTMTKAKQLLDQVFNGDTYALIQDNQDMTMTVCLAGAPPTAILTSLLTGGYIPIRPEGVGIKYYVIPKTTGPLFGWGVNNNYIDGWSSGQWGSVIQG